MYAFAFIPRVVARSGSKKTTIRRTNMTTTIPGISTSLDLVPRVAPLLHLEQLIASGSHLILKGDKSVVARKERGGVREELDFGPRGRIV